MTRKDYELVSKVLNNNRAKEIRGDRKTVARAMWESIVTGMAMEMACQNKRFNPSKFFDACGLHKKEKGRGN